MDGFDAMVARFGEMPLAYASSCALAWNVIVFCAAVVAGNAIVGRLGARSVAPPPPPLLGAELALAGACVLLNSAVAVAGLLLWRRGIIVLAPSTAPRVLLDAVVLVLAMDLGMYVTHRLAHHALLYPVVHRTHHRFPDPRPLTLFVLNPVEVMGFGGLWLVVLCLYRASPVGIAVYLTLNVLFGLFGHLGVEPMPAAWTRLPLLRLVGTSTFHAEHHRDEKHNFGFYTLFWDRLFGTTSPAYEREFEEATRGPARGAWRRDRAQR